MNNAQEVARIQAQDRITDPCLGKVCWAPGKSAWISSMYLGAMIGGPLTFSWDAVVLFLATSAVTLCAGHSVGMHRRLIHNSFECPRWLEYSLIHLGVLVGLAGPFSIIRMHDFRDWAQRQPTCHDYFSSRQGLLKDAFWILHCDLKLDYSPGFRCEQRIVRDRVLHLMERTRLLQQMIWAIAFFEMGGVSWVVWGICVRVSVCVTGHWWIGRLAHRSGHRDWHVEGSGVQGYNVRFCGLITMGECWHNNHHAFPQSAQIGIFPGQNDPGWWLIRMFECVGLAWQVKQPADLPMRKELRALDRLAQSSLLIH